MWFVTALAIARLDRLMFDLGIGKEILVTVPAELRRLLLHSLPKL